MFTLKIKWIRSEEQDVVDETTLFIAADEIQVGSIIKSIDEMKAWEPGSFFNYKVEGMDARNVQVVQAGRPSWYLASMAWLMGPDGKTIERLI